VVGEGNSRITVSLLKPHIRFYKVFLNSDAASGATAAHIFESIRPQENAFGSCGIVFFNFYDLLWIILFLKKNNHPVYCKTTVCSMKCPVQQPWACDRAWRDSSPHAIKFPNWKLPKLEWKRLSIHKVFLLCMILQCNKGTFCTGTGKFVPRQPACESAREAATERYTGARENGLAARG
jgi:hypothetical protein